VPPGTHPHRTVLELACSHSAKAARKHIIRPVDVDDCGDEVGKCRDRHCSCCLAAHGHRSRSNRHWCPGTLRSTSITFRCIGIDAVPVRERLGRWGAREPFKQVIYLKSRALAATCAPGPVPMGHGTPGTVQISAPPDRSDPSVIQLDLLSSPTPSPRRRRLLVDVDVAKGAFGRITDRCSREMQRSALLLMTYGPWTQAQ
jgi:hypothetical protein